MMLDYLKEEQNYTLTENGAVTLKSSGLACLDLFGTIGALRYADENDVILRFSKAYAENADMAMKTLFFARDIREGLGERKVFRTIFNWLSLYHPESVKKNLKSVSEYGRFDDLLCLLGTPCQNEMVAVIQEQLNADLKAQEENKPVSLLAKWMPSVNTSSKATVMQAKQLAKALGLKQNEYRKLLSKLRKYIGILENNLREKDYSFDYEKQPSKAMMKYQEAFWRNDSERYQKYLDKVEVGSATMHTGTLYPYDVVKPIVKSLNWSYNSSLDDTERKTLDVTWNALEDYTRGENALVVVDGSGSMYGAANGMPAMVALSLGIYFAERNKGAFHNHFITFSSKPQLVEVEGDNIVEKVEHCASYNEVANTNLQRVFDLILVTAVKHHVPQKQIPSTLYLISDMEFDQCVEQGRKTNFEVAKNKFAQYGYQLPNIVFWNVASRNQQQPVKIHDTGTALVSGCSPRIFSMLMNKQFSPYTYMIEVLSSERYSQIVA